MTSDELIQAVRDYANLSSSAEDSQDTQLLRALNREQSLYLATLIEKAKGRHNQATLDIAVDPSTLRYPIPSRAIAAGIKMIEGVDTSGQSWMFYDYPDELAARHGRWTAPNGDFYIEGNDIVFYGEPPAGIIRITYFRRLSTLVLEASVGTIATVDTNTGVVTISAAPSDFETAADDYDLVRSTPHFDILAMDITATRSGTTMTFTADDLPATLEIGDYVCQSGETAVCQAPAELHNLLALRTAYVWSRAKNDPIANVLAGDLKEAAGLATSLLEPRIEQDSVLVAPYAPGWGSWRRGSP